MLHARESPCFTVAESHKKIYHTSQVKIRQRLFIWHLHQLSHRVDKALKICLSSFPCFLTPSQQTGFSTKRQWKRGPDQLNSNANIQFDQMARINTAIITKLSVNLSKSVIKLTSTSLVWGSAKRSFSKPKIFSYLFYTFDAAHRICESMSRSKSKMWLPHCSIPVLPAFNLETDDVH